MITFFASFLFIMGLCLLLGAVVLFIWTTQQFWFGATWEYLTLAMMIAISGLTLMLIAWRMTRRR
jgi:hypothetical protein